MSRNAHHAPHMFRMISLLLIVAVTLSPFISLSFPKTEDEGKPLIRIEYVLHGRVTKEFFVNGSDVLTVEAPPNPSGYQLKQFELTPATPFPENLVPVTYDRKVEIGGETVKLISYSGTIGLAPQDSFNATFKAIIDVYYVKTEWVGVTGGLLNITVSEPEPPFAFNNLTVKVTVENFLPVRIAGLIGPDGANMLSVEAQDLLPPDAIAIDPKHLQLNFAAGLPPGTYTILFAEDEDSVMPNAFIVAEDGFTTYMLNGGESKTFTGEEMDGWDTMGYLVVLYSVAPSDSLGIRVDINAPMIDYMYNAYDIFRLGSGASYLVPPIDVSLWMKMYVVYGAWFNITNLAETPLQVMYTPIRVKEAGVWTPNGVTITVNEDELAQMNYSYVVVQVPPYGRITGVTTPDGEALGEFMDTTLAWRSGSRAISVADTEMYVQVKAGGVVEAGTYTVSIKWQPITVKALDSAGRPVADVKAVFTGPEEIAATTDSDGTASVTLYHPGIYTVSAEFKGVKVYEDSYITLDSGNLTMACAIHDLTVKVKGTLGQPIYTAEVTVSMHGNQDVSMTGETGNDGTVTFTQLPAGNYSVEVKYKRITGTSDVELSQSQTVEVTIDMLLELPFLGLPLSLAETIGIAAGVAGAAVAVAFIGRRKLEDFS